MSIFSLSCGNVPDIGARLETVFAYSWYYGGYDYCLFSIEANGQMSNIALPCYKNSSNFLWYYLPKESLIDNQWHHLVVMTDLQQSYCRKIIYLDGQKIVDKKETGDFSNWIDNTAHTDMNVLTENYTRGTLANLLFFDRLLTEQEVLYLYLNPQYPVKNYTLADWAIDPANPDSSIKNLTPKYLGVTETVTVNSAVLIVKGEKTGYEIANPGDWVLMGKTVGGWKVGVCYRWTGSMWINLEPEYNYTEQYQAALYHICEIEELMKNTGHFGALFAKVLVAQQAFIDKLVAQEAFITKLSGDIAFLKELTTQKVFVENLIANNSFIKKLATQDAFLDNLVAKKLKIDNDEQNPNDFEVAINNDIGILAKNNGQEIFRIKKSGEAFLNDAELKNVTVTGKITPNRGLLNTWYWGKMAYTNQYEWFNVFKDRIDVGERLNIFGGGCFYNQKKGGWQYAIVVFIERLSEDVFELNGYPMHNQGGYLTQATFQKNSNKAFASSFYIGW